MQTSLFGDGPTPVHRLFLALLPDDAVRRAVADEAARWHAACGGDGRVVNPGRYHMTLQFFGEFDASPPSLVERVRRTVDAIERPPAFGMTLDRAGRFGGVGWFGPATTPEPLRALLNALAAALARAGVRVVDAQRAFVPHVTALRDLRCAPAAHAIAPIEWRADRVALVDSRSGDVPPRYDRLDEWRLE